MKKSIFDFEVKKKPVDNDKYLFFLKNDINETLAEILASNTIVNEENYNDFLSPKLKNLIPNPNVLTDCEKSAEVFIKYIKDGKKFGFICDYDVDGSTCAAMINIFFRKINYNNFVVHVPNRITEGYGPSKFAIDKLISLGCDIITSMDCGINAHEVVEYSNNKGVLFCIIDHHKEDEIKGVPSAYAVVNPNRVDCKSGLNNLSAAGVLFIFLIKLNSLLEKKVEIIDLINLVCLSTICDVMSLSGLNRAFYKYGSGLVKKRTHYGLNKLLEKLNVDLNNVSSSTFGYKIGPVINAGGRLCENDSQYTGYKILRTTEQDQDIDRLCDEAINMNIVRGEIERQISDSVEIDNEFVLKNKFIFVYDKNWHEGLIGIIASRLKERYHCPCFVGYENDVRIVKMSSRSVDNIDIGNAILKGVNAGILIKGGGHKKAGGLTMSVEKVEEFKQLLIEECKIETKKEILYNSILSINKIDIEFCKKLETLEPFGIDNPACSFLITGCKLFKFEEKEKYISVVAKSDIGNKIFYLSAFNKDKKIIDFLNEKISQNIQFVGEISANFFNQKEYLSIIVKEFLL